MGKSNYLNINKKTNQKNKIHNILNPNEIKILEKINKNFIKKIIIYFSTLIKNDIKLNFFSITSSSYADNDKYIKFLLFIPIEILNSKKQSFILFSDNLVSVFIDVLFGGNGFCGENITKERNLTYTEQIISQKIINLIFKAYSKTFEKFCSISIKPINIKIININNSSFLKKDYITNYFNLSVNGINIFFSILLPLSIVQLSLKKIISLEINKSSLINNINLKKNIFVNNIYDIELDIITQLIIPNKVNYNSLSVGEILIIQNPDRVISYIEEKPILLGSYKNFTNKSVIFFEKFIDKNIDFNKCEDV